MLRVQKFNCILGNGTEFNEHGVERCDQNGIQHALDLERAHTASNARCEKTREDAMHQVDEGWLGLIVCSGLHFGYFHNFLEGTSLQEHQDSRETAVPESCRNKEHSLGGASVPSRVHTLPSYSFGFSCRDVVNRLTTLPGGGGHTT
jgi:hypothetical protein